MISRALHPTHAPSGMSYITAVCVLAVASLSDFRMRCICFVVSILGSWRLLGPSHSWFSFGGEFLLLCGVLSMSSVFHTGRDALFLVGVGFADVCIALLVGVVPLFRARRG